MNSFSTDGLDLSLVDEFENLQDIRSYLIHKYGLEFAERVLALVPLYLPDNFPNN